ncbi:hypothetical protein F4780DRAFT_78264 [Xylariomycetidae sp. FL0641]|nr:hypothetical protein F4780DRAFT_78264 [Xylariomycetidae sp. FL0641]
MASSDSDPDQVLEYFDKALRVRVLDCPDRNYAFEAVFQADHPLASVALQHKPPVHFHPYQEEYIEALKGKLAVEIAGHTHVLSPGDGQLSVKPWVHHRLYPLEPDDAAEGPREMGFRVSGQRSSEAFSEDILFLQNLYGYQNELVMNKGKFNLLQILCMFDAGGSYVSLPPWVPFGRSISRGLGVVVGRWLASLLGYQPYYEKWSGDWELACSKMRTSRLQRRFASKSRTQ